VAKRYRVKSWLFWQYTATGVLDGIEKEVDLNCFNGSEAQWKQWRKTRAVH
jgi:lysozyme